MQRAPAQFTATKPALQMHVRRASSHAACLGQRNPPAHVTAPPPQNPARAQYQSGAVHSVPQSVPSHVRAANPGAHPQKLSKVHSAFVGHVAPLVHVTVKSSTRPHAGVVHWPVSSHTCPVGHGGPHAPPQSSLPHTRPAQSGTSEPAHAPLQVPPAVHDSTPSRQSPMPRDAAGPS